MTILYIILGIIGFFILMQLALVFKMKLKKGKPAPQINGKAGQLVSRGHKVLFYFFSPSCRACKPMTPVITNMAKKNNNVFPVDVSRDMQTAQKFGIMGTPSLVLVQGGKIREYLVGAQPEEKITEMLL